jgi:hypothetical protein
MKIRYPAHPDGTISPQESASGTTTMYFVTSNNNDTYLALASYKDMNSSKAALTWSNKGNSDVYIFKIAPGTNPYTNIRNSLNFTNFRYLKNGDSRIASWEQLKINPSKGTSYNTMTYIKGSSIPNLSDQDYETYSSFLNQPQENFEKKAVSEDFIKRDGQQEETLLN